MKHDLQSGINITKKAVLVDPETSSHRYTGREWRTVVNVILIVFPATIKTELYIAFVAMSAEQI